MCEPISGCATDHWSSRFKFSLGFHLPIEILLECLLLICMRPVADTTHYCISAATNIQNNIFGCLAIVGRIEFFSLINWAKGIKYTEAGPTNRLPNKSNCVDVVHNEIGIKRNFHRIRTSTCRCVWIAGEESLNLCADQMCYTYTFNAVNDSSSIQLCS